ncbi:hypothetical protein NMY22_g11289 [Coprinellus aureogranulatus]|nr:hypothetical protein NMY22_g11289 [Coprinellus aureogranulatus]
MQAMAATKANVTALVKIISISIILSFSLSQRSSDCRYPRSYHIPLASLAPHPTARTIPAPQSGVLDRTPPVSRCRNPGTHHPLPIRLYIVSSRLPVSDAIVRDASRAVWASMGTIKGDDSDSRPPDSSVQHGTRRFRNGKTMQITKNLYALGRLTALWGGFLRIACDGRRRAKFEFHLKLAFGSMERENAGTGAPEGAARPLFADTGTWFARRRKRAPESLRADSIGADMAPSSTDITSVVLISVSRPNFVRITSIGSQVMDLLVFRSSSLGASSVVPFSRSRGDRHNSGPSHLLLKTDTHAVIPSAVYIPGLHSTKTRAQRWLGHPEDTVPIIDSTEWSKGLFKNPGQKIQTYLLSLFPIIQWLPRYNFGWLSGDIIAGLTVGMVVVPQGMSYAQLAGLTAEYGLYSSFVGVLIYCVRPTHFHHFSLLI